jgi:hypothetical protein
MVSAVASIPADVVLSAVDVPVVYAVAKVSAVATIPTYVDVLSATGISNVSCIPAVVVVPVVADFSTVIKHPFCFCFHRLLRPDTVVRWLYLCYIFHFTFQAKQVYQKLIQKFSSAIYDCRQCTVYRNL